MKDMEALEMHACLLGVQSRLLEQTGRLRGRQSVNCRAGEVDWE